MREKQEARPKSTGKRIVEFILGLAFLGYMVKSCFPLPPPRPKRPQEHRAASGSPTRQTVCNDKARGYSISYPAAWDRLPKEAQQALRTNRPPQVELLLGAWSPDRKLIMQVTREGGIGSVGVAELYQKQFADPGTRFAVHAREDTTIGGVKGIRSVYSTKTPDGKPAKYVALFLVRAGYLWNVGIGGEPRSFDANQRVIEGILASLTFQGIGNEAATSRPSGETPSGQPSTAPTADSPNATTKPDLKGEREPEDPGNMKGADVPGKGN